MLFIDLEVSERNSSLIIRVFRVRKCTHGRVYVRVCEVKAEMSSSTSLSAHPALSLVCVSDS